MVPGKLTGQLSHGLKILPLLYVLHSKLGNGIKYGKQIFSFFCEGIFYMRRDFVELFPRDDAVTNEIPEGAGEHGVGDFLEHGHFFEFAKPYCTAAEESVNDLQFPFSLEQQNNRRDGTLLAVCEERVPYIVFKFFQCHYRFPFHPVSSSILTMKILRT